MEHKVLSTGLHIISHQGLVQVFTEKEYSHLEWWFFVKLKYNLQ